MAMITELESTALLRPEPTPNDSNTLYPVILITAILCTILTTAFTAARLIAKRMILAYELEDCECQVTSPRGPPPKH